MRVTGVSLALVAVCLSMSACRAPAREPSCPPGESEAGPREAPTGVAPVVSSAPVAAPRPPFEDAIGEEARARAREVARARAGQADGPFQPSGIWLPPVYVADAERSVEWIGLLYVQRTDFDAGTRTRVLPPLFLSTAGPDGRTLVTPLLGMREDAEGAGGYVLDYVWRRNRLDDADVVFPFFWSFRERDFEGGPDARSSGSIAPLVFWNRKTSGEHHTFALPLFWQWGDSQASTTIAGPVYSHDEPEGSHFGCVPLYFASREAGSATDVLVPLLLFRSTEGDRTRFFAVNTYYASRPDGYSFASLPLVFAGRTGDSHYSMALPLFFNWGDKNESSWVVGTAFHHDEPGESDNGVLPFWMRSEHGGQQTDLVPPLLFCSWRGEGASTWIAGPAFHHEDPQGSSLGFLPLFAHGSNEQDGTSQTWVLNTYYGSRPDGYSLASFPLVFAGKSGDESYAHALPLFFSWASKDSSTWIAGPAFHHEDPQGSSLGFLPLFAHGSNEQDGTSQTWVLNTYYGSRPDGYSLASFPLVFAGKSGDESYAHAFPLFFSWANKDSSTWIAGTAFHHEAPHESSLGVLPLFTHSSNETTGESSSWILNTFYGSRPDGYSLASLPLLFAGRSGESYHAHALPLFFSWGNADTSTWIAGPAFHHEEPQQSKTGVLPLFVHSTDEGARTSTSWLLNSYYSSRPEGYSFGFAPLLFAGGDGDDGYAIAPPLFWHFADSKKSTTVAGPFYSHSTPDGWDAGLAPLWFSGRSADGTAYDVGAPLLWRFQGPEGDRLAVLPLFDYARDETRRRLISPVFYRHDGLLDASSTTVVLGLYWDFDRVGSHARVAFPLWWSFEDAEAHSRLSTAFPLYWCYEREGETTSVLLNSAWSSGTGARGATWSFHLFPILDLASDAPTHLQWQVLGGMLGREREGALHRWRFLWSYTDPSS